jgi:hypothetical protein
MHDCFGIGGARSSLSVTYELQSVLIAVQDFMALLVLNRSTRLGRAKKGSIFGPLQPGGQLVLSYPCNIRNRWRPIQRRDRTHTGLC